MRNPAAWSTWAMTRSAARCRSQTCGDTWLKCCTIADPFRGRPFLGPLTHYVTSRTIECMVDVPGRIRPSGKWIDMRSRRLAVIGAIVLWNRSDRGSFARSGAGTERPGSPIADPLVQTGSVTAGSGSEPVYGSGTVCPRDEIHVAPLLQRADDEMFVTGSQRGG